MRVVGVLLDTLKFGFFFFPPHLTVSCTPAAWPGRPSLIVPNGLWQ